MQVRFNMDYWKRWIPGETVLALFWAISGRTLPNMDRSHSQSMMNYDTNMDQLQFDYKLNAG